MDALFSDNPAKMLLEDNSPQSSPFMGCCKDVSASSSPTNFSYLGNNIWNETIPFHAPERDPLEGVEFDGLLSSNREFIDLETLVDSFESSGHFEGNVLSPDARAPLPIDAYLPFEDSSSQFPEPQEEPVVEDTSDQQVIRVGVSQACDEAADTTAEPVKRKRGRPRKHPKPKDSEEGANEKRKRRARRISLTEDLLFADPANITLCEEDLKPLPIIKKNKKKNIPSEAKDDSYWARREKNNVAAKRSRDARRIKENQIAIRASFLERQHAKMSEDLEIAQKTIESLKRRLSKYEEV